MNLLTTVVKTGTDRQDVTLNGDTIVITDQDRTRIFDKHGVRQGTDVMRTGTETQTVLIKGDRILIHDTDQVRVFDLSGRQIRSVPISNVQSYDVQLFDQLFTITDMSTVRIFDRDGVLQGQPIGYSQGVQHVQVAGDRVIIVDGNRTMLFDLQATQVGSTLISRGDPEVYPACWEPGSLTPFGTGCAGSAGTPSQTAFGEPRIGGSTTYLLQNAPASSPVSMNLGFSTTSWNGIPLPLNLAIIGAPGCLIYTDAMISLATATGAAGMAQVTVDIPAEAALVGIDAHTQFLVPDAGANPFGLTVSSAVTTHVGEGY